MPHSPNVIVDPADVLPKNMILEEDWTLLKLGCFIKEDDPLSCLKWLAQRKLIRNSFHCNTCNLACGLYSYLVCTDQFRWSCRRCNMRSSVRKDSMFEKSRLPLWKIVTIMYCWCRDMPRQHITHESKLSSGRHTLNEWTSFFRNVCEEWVIENPSEIGGLDDNGMPIEVEVDELDFFHTKYTLGEWLEGHWVFGGVERISGKYFMVEVPDRTAATLESVVTKYILPGSRIISDCRRTYGNLSEIRNGIYLHDIVSRSEDYGGPFDDSVHTQNIENVWLKVKTRFSRQLATSDVLYSTYLSEILWRASNRDKNLFSAFIVAVQYRLDE